MSDWTNATTSSHLGVLRPDRLAEHVQLDRHPCAPAVAPWVENYWTLRWGPLGDRGYLSQTLPHPTCSLSVERGWARPGVGADRVVLTGVVTTRFDVDLQGSGSVFGVKFRPGGLADFSRHSARPWRDRVLPAREVLPAVVSEAMAEMAADLAISTQARLVDQTLTDVRPVAPDPRYTQLLEVVADMLAERTLLTVADVGARHRLSVRSLQRLFAHYLGVGPKWVLARYRMHDAVRALDSGYPGSLTDLAADHGWYDQAHFTRAFVALTGVTPARYREASP